MNGVIGIVIAFAILASTESKTASYRESKRAISRNDLSTFATDLWYADYNSVDQGYHYSLNLNDKAKSKPSNYNYGKLISSLKESEVFNRPTYSTFVKLLDNYNPMVGVAERITAAEKREVQAFLDEIIKTDVILKTYNFLSNNNYVKKSGLSNFKTLLYDMWFTMYSRKNGVKDSSGFEHVFVGEFKGNDVGGLHNWIQYYLLEKKGRIKYKGYIVNRQPNLLKIQFMLDTWKKDSAGMFHGTSPEFELAMYTVCFLTRMGKACEFKIDNYFVRIQTYRVNYMKSNVIATAYPAI